MSTAERARSGDSIVGLIPAAGLGSRLGAIPCSKELLPVGFSVRAQAHRLAPKPVSEYLIDQMVHAGCDRIFFILRHGKWDIPAYYGSGADFGVDIGYLLANELFGPPFTLGQAASFVRGAIVATGFPDILIHPPDMLAGVVEALRATPDADLMLGTLPTDETAGTDRVRPAADGRLATLVPKEEHPAWEPNDCAWVLAAWRPRFTRFLVEELARLREIARKHEGPGGPEWPLGSVISAALAAGLDIRTRYYDHARHLDIGAPERITRAADFPGVWNGR